MWRQGNVGVTPSRAECAGVPLSVKCHLLCSLTSFTFFLIRQVAVSWLSVAVTHTLRKAISELSEERRSLLLQTAAILYMHSITGSLSLFTALISLSLFNSPGFCSHRCLSAYSSGFCEPVTYAVPASLCFLLSFRVEVFAMWSIWSC